MKYLFYGKGKTNMEIKLTDLNSELWETFRGAYGNVSKEVAILMGEPMTEPQKKIRRLDTEEKEDYHIVFDNLCENLSHQMSFYKATYLALPYLVTLFGKESKNESFEWKLTMLSEIGLCLATDIPSNHEDQLDDEEILRSYEASVLKLQELTRQFIKQYEKEIAELDFNERSMLVTALLAILGDREATFILTMSCWDTCYMLCDCCEYCEEEAVLSDDEAKEAIVPAETMVGKWDGSSYDDTYLWISNVLNRLGAEEELEILSYYYGTYTCPECGNQKKVIDLMKNYYFEG